MRLISVEMPDAPFHGIDELVKRGIYPSRNAVMRAAVGDLLQKELLPALRREQAGSSLQS